MFTDHVPDVFYTEWFFLYYGSGIFTGVWEPWLEVVVTERLLSPASNEMLNNPVLELGLSGQYFSDSSTIPVPPMTNALEKIHLQLHDWVQPLSWVSGYKNFLF